MQNGCPAGNLLEVPMSLPDVKAMSTADLDLLLEAITIERAKREPAVSMEQPPKSEAAVDPRWHLFMVDANTILQLRHPGHGWVSFLIPPASRAQLLSFLLQQALMPPPKADTPVPVVSTGGGTVH
jgi:hypothetical protein